MQKIAVAMMLLFLVFSQMDSVEPSAADCLDACSTGCVQRDSKSFLNHPFPLCIVFCSLFTPKKFQIYLGTGDNHRN